jgi:two-component system cell cycle response regulator DivK
MARGRILIVDDFDDARELYSEFLSAQDYDVSGAADGPEALNLALPAQYDVIVLDLALPRMDGLEVLRQLRRNPATRRTPIIILSASVGQEPREDAMEAGADLFLEKPCLPDELEAAIQTFLPKAVRTARSSRK